jgi:hypothetical protein
MDQGVHILKSLVGKTGQKSSGNFDRVTTRAFYALKTYIRERYFYKKSCEKAPKFYIFVKYSAEGL